MRPDSLAFRHFQYSSTHIFSHLLLIHIPPQQAINKQLLTPFHLITGWKLLAGSELAYPALSFIYWKGERDLADKTITYSGEISLAGLYSTLLFCFFFAKQILANN